MLMYNHLLCNAENILFIELIIYIIKQSQCNKGLNFKKNQIRFF